MTPLAAYLAGQLVARPKHREGIWRDPENIEALRVALHDIHCFEITQCAPLFTEMVRLSKRPDTMRSVYETLGFLPAPKTWLEWASPRGGRVGVLLEDVGEGADSTFSDVVYVAAFSFDGMRYCGRISPSNGKVYTPPGEQADRNVRKIVASALIMLPMINSPKIIGRRQHMPNVGLERNLTRGFGVGKFPLHAWTEIKLEVNKPIEIDDGEPHEAHLTGRRALHFCRKHIRIRNGQLEYVSAHWRGDPALGIKRSRYVVSA